jgi:putative tricarboxylic transport membrane protein
MAGFVGLDPRTAELRYTFGTSYLQDGLDVVPLFLGIFAVAEVIDLLASGRATISGKRVVEELTGSVREGIAAVFRHFGLFLRSSALGTLIGAIPGVGSTVAGLIAYGHAARSARSDSQRFGHGDIRGVLAPEAANDAKDGGALIPTLVFGVPGGAGTAVLLSVMALHGITPGFEVLDTRLTLVFALIWSLFISNWLTSILGMAAVKPLARLTVVPTHFLAPVILSLATMASFIYRGRPEDVFVAFGAGIAGYYLKKHGWPRVPFVIALVLGPLFERNFLLYLQLKELGRISFWSHPIAVALAILTVLSLVYPLLPSRRARRLAASEN